MNTYPDLAETATKIAQVITEWLIPDAESLITVSGWGTVGMVNIKIDAEELDRMLTVNIMMGPRTVDATVIYGDNEICQKTWSSLPFEGSYNTTPYVEYSVWGYLNEAWEQAYGRLNAFERETVRTVLTASIMATRHSHL